MLPKELLQGAILRDGECAWELAEFPKALAAAPQFGYACLGGQIWFILSDGSLYEPFWLAADSLEKTTTEAWSDYVSRSCREVAGRFNALLIDTNFEEEALKFKSLTSAFEIKFNAYFVTEAEWRDLGVAAVDIDFV